MHNHYQPSLATKIECRQQSKTRIHMYISIYHMGHIPASDLNNMKGIETPLLLYIMGTIINSTLNHENG